nr:type III-B CRISPR-associated protein Cas10/Cmr2 [Trichocoleus sp. FACHB-591]
MPAETRLPDSSIWSHASLTAALSGALAGYNLTSAEIAQWPNGQQPSHPYLAAFSFTPIQELIKASRKMRDFWAGSWILHYLSAKVCWTLASKYGPDSLVYPSLFQQPLIDHWLLQQWPEFEEWIPQPQDQKLLTAGFPNVIVMVLPKDKVQAAMQLAEETLKHEWLEIGHLVLAELQGNRAWMRALQEDHKTWKGWLSRQWQTYWSAVAIGKEGEPFKNSAIPELQEPEFQPWMDAQNRAYGAGSDRQLFQVAELAFLRAAYEHRLDTQGRKFSVNVGSWWPYVFDRTRASLAAVKNARTWELPTAFSVRSTVSGIGSAVHPGEDWMPERKVKQLWKHHAGLFDGREQLNATETLKRGLHKVLPKLLQRDQIAVTYPDLSAGVAGYLKVSNHSALQHFRQACGELEEKLKKEGLKEVLQIIKEERWGIPWIDANPLEAYRNYHSRYLNLGWLLEDADQSERLNDSENKVRERTQQVLDRYYPANNPADWYVLAAGDGDNMSEWLKGMKLEAYQAYVPSTLKPSKPLEETFEKFLEQTKRMGPSTHAALSRALLDFSNQLVPHLTEQRYAGRLIYSGGDDVLAYTNLWEWDQWLWDIQQCFKGDHDPEKARLELQQGNTSDSQGYFKRDGDYWLWQGDPKVITPRPLFTLGQKATISFGVVIAHHSVPLAIALERLWEAEAQAKKHCSPEGEVKDAVQVRVLYGNGNMLEATTKFKAFDYWRSLLDFAEIDLDPALFEQAAQVWSQHPVPMPEAISPWTQAFCDRRDLFQGKTEIQARFQQRLVQFLTKIWQTTPEADLDLAVQSWLKLAAFVLRKRCITIPSGGQP